MPQLSFPYFSSSQAVLNPTFSHRFEIIQSLLKERQDRLLFITDFDHTLTTMASNQCHDPIGLNPLYPLEVQEGFKAILRQERSTWSEWWSVAHNYVVANADVTRSLFIAGLNECKFEVRQGIHNLFSFLLDEQKLPVLIVSAGMSDVISEVLIRKERVLSSMTMPCDHKQAEILEETEAFICQSSNRNVFILANYMVFDSDEKLVDILPVEPVHSKGKHILPSHFPHIFNSRTDSGSDQKFDIAVIVGDSVGDFAVVDELSYFTTLKIGFAESDVKAKILIEEPACCDLVLCGKEHDLHAVSQLMQALYHL